MNEKEKELEGTKKLIQNFLRRTAVLAKIGIENEEWTREEAETFVMEYGNEQFGKILNMGDEEFMLFAMGEAVQTLSEHIMEEMK